MAPALCALSTVLFLAERALLDGTPRLATVLELQEETELEDNLRFLKRREEAVS